MNAEASILLIYTGGTIGMVMDPATGVLKAFNLNNLLSTIPELQNINFKIHSTSFDQPIDSSNVGTKDWVSLSHTIRDNYDKFDGFVILHGTDTMAFTASALSFMLSGLDKPVIFTGSQLPIGMVRTDGKENLLTALEIAAATDENGRPRVPEVCIYFDSYLYRGNRSHKSSTQNFEAFSSPNFPALAEAGVEIFYLDKIILPMDRKKFKIYDKLDEHIQVLTLFPGQPLELLSNLMNYEQLSGIVLRSYGAGNASSNKKFLKIIETLVKRDVVVLNITQCAHGAVNQKKYETGAQLQDLGVIGGRDITLEAALAKMMVSLGNFNLTTVKSNLDKSLRGELTEQQ